MFKGSYTITNCDVKQKKKNPIKIVNISLLKPKSKKETGQADNLRVICLHSH